jgi:HK97 family phage major capsid protein
MNNKTAAAVRKLKDADGGSIWAESLQGGQPSRLLGFPIETDVEFLDYDSGSLSVAFGAFMESYCVVEWRGVRLQRDPFTARPSILFYAYMRVGGGLAHPEAVKLLNFAAT